jgi:elongation factor P
MDTERYDQITLSKEQMGDKINYIKENMNIHILMYEGRPLDIDLPTFVELKVEHTPPGIKGDTVSGGTKTATLETGLKVKVPLFINEGDVLKIDTRNDEYMERVENN